MALKAKAKYSMAENLHRLLLGQIDRAVKSLKDFEKDPEESVHTVRKALKQSRTILQLIRRELGKRQFRRFNGYFRDMGLRLSSQRDASVKAKTLKKVSDEAQMTTLDSAAENATPITPEDKEAATDVLGQLKKLREDIVDWHFKKHGFALIQKSLRRIYKKGLRDMRHASHSQLDEDFHEWRKSSKHLFYFITMMVPVNKEVYKPMRKDLSVLTETLGDDHDLSILKAEITHNTMDANEKQALLSQIRKDQRELRKQAREIGKRLYSEPTKEFVKRLEKSWKEWRNQ